MPAAVDGIRAKPDVVLLDVHLPGGAGRAVLETLRRELPDVRWLALSVSDAAEDVIAVIRAGARGYVTKTISGPDRRSAVRRVADGDVVFSPRLAGFVLDAFSAAVPAAVPPPGGGDGPGTRPAQLPASARSCSCWPAATPTARSGSGCSSRSRRWSHTRRTCCASSSCPTATSSPAGRRRTASCDLFVLRTRRGLAPSPTCVVPRVTARAERSRRSHSARQVRPCGRRGRPRPGVLRAARTARR